MITAGVLQIGTGGRLARQCRGRQSLIFNNAGSNVVNGAVSGGGNLVIPGGGTVVLAGTSTYSGGTSVSNGTLLVKNTLGSGTGSGGVTVFNGGTLSGSGVVAGPVSNT